MGEEIQLHTVTNEPAVKLPVSQALCDFSYILAYNSESYTSLIK